MSKTRIIQFRVDKFEYERISNNAKARGFRTVAAYLRFVALDNDLIFEKKFDEIYRMIIKKE